MKIKAPHGRNFNTKVVHQGPPQKKRSGTVSKFAAVILWMFLPMIPVFVAGAVASACGCQLDEGGVHPCVVFGMDIGGMLYNMSMMGWFGLLTFPSGFIALAVLTRALKKERNRDSNL